MKKLLLSAVLISLFVLAGAQKSIEWPPFKGTTADYIKILKIELSDTATVIDFRVHFTPGMWIRVARETYIQDSKGGEKLFVKSARGIKLDQEHFTPENGVNEYTLCFPSVPEGTRAIDYRESAWKIFGIELEPQEHYSIFPEEIRGNWLRTDGSNEWVCSIYEDVVIYDCEAWWQVMIRQKEDIYQLMLQKDGKKKLLTVKSQEGKLLAGDGSNKMELLSREPTSVQQYSMTRNEKLDKPVFQKDSAFYAGYIKGYDPRMGETGMIYINNIITHEQESYVIKINPDGSFSAGFPMLYAQPVFVKLFRNNESIYMEPGKTTFRLYDCSRYHDDPGPSKLFMGATAIVNRDLADMDSIRYYAKTMDKILDMNPEEYKKYILDIKEKELQALDEFTQKRQVSAKAAQIKQMQIEFEAAQRILSYNMDREGVYRRKNNVPRDQREIPLERVTHTNDFYDFLDADKLNDSVSVVSGSAYEVLINRMRFAEGMFLRHIKLRTTADDYFNEFDVRQIELTAGEKEVVRKIGSASDSVRLNLFRQDSVYVKDFVDRYNDVFRTVNTRNHEVQYRKHQDEAMQDLFGLTKGSFARDVMLIQRYFERMRSAFKPLDDWQKEEIKNEVADNFMVSLLFEASDQLERENAEKRSAIKKGSGFIVNETPEITEGDLFDTIMKKYRGKVIFVDFWATWCGPCRSGMERIKPLKEEMKDQELVFVYITNPSSSKDTWEMLIPDVDGEHYYLTQDEWNTMASRFKVSGIPHYVLVGKDGKVIRDKIYFASSNLELKKMFEEHL